VIEGSYLPTVITYPYTSVQCGYMSHTPGADSKLLTAPQTVTCTNLATLGAIMSLGGLQTLLVAPRALACCSVAVGAVALVTLSKYS
jgi:hypothetical protein